MLSQAVLAGALQAAPDALVIVDAAGLVLFANDHMRAVFGHAPDALLGQPVEMLLPARLRGAHAAHRLRFASERHAVRPMGSGAMELVGLHAAGHEFPVEISLSALDTGEAPLVAAVIRDVSRQRDAERSLLQARQAAERANAAKTRFLASASHDLRQPLQSLGLLNGSLRRMVRDTDAADALALQEQAIASMSRLLNALLDISKLESGAVKADMGDFALDGLFEELQREFGPVAQARDLRLFVTAAPHRVHSDRTMLGAVLRNLLSNALKYTREGEVRLHCQPVAEGLRIEVRDTGVGIAAEHLGSICEEFYQVAPVPGVSREGYGLGLSIVARLLKLLGLRLEVDTVPGKGSSFAVCVPLAAGEPAWRDDPPPGPAAVASATATPGGARARRILLVEDDEGVRNATRLLLKLEGFQVTAAASLLQALNATTGSSPELLITDYHLGAGESGLDVIRALRARHGATLPAILVSGDTSPGVQQIPEDASLHRIAKPIHAEQLLALIRQLLP